MTTDTRTTNRDYQLPFPSNLLAADVVRLREALIAIDVDVDGLLDGLATKLTQAQTQVLISDAIDALVAGAPGALDTLQELAAALNNDADFAATVANALATLGAEIDALEAEVAAKASIGLAIALG